MTTLARRERNATAGGRAVAVLAGTALAAAVLAAPARAQAPEEDAARWSAEARAGIALPSGELAGVAEPGPTVGGGAAYWVSPRVAVRGEVAVDLYTSAEPFGPFEEAGPDTRLWHTTAGVLVRFTDEDVPGWTTTLGMGAGAVSFDSDSFVVPATDRTESFSFEETYFSPYANVRVAYALSENARVTVGARGALIVADESDTRVFEEATGGRVQPFNTSATFPFTLGVTWAP